jgi:hypothetical protein
VRPSVSSPNCLSFSAARPFRDQSENEFEGSSANRKYVQGFGKYCRYNSACCSLWSFLLFEMPDNSGRCSTRKGPACESGQKVRPCKTGRPKRKARLKGRADRKYLTGSVMVGNQSKAGRIVRSLVNTGGLFSFGPREQLAWFGQAQCNAGRHDEEIGFAWNMRNGRTSNPCFRLTSPRPPSRKKTHHWVGGPRRKHAPGVVFLLNNFRRLSATLR